MENRREEKRERKGKKKGKRKQRDGGMKGKTEANYTEEDVMMMKIKGKETQEKQTTEGG